MYSPTSLTGLELVEVGEREPFIPDKRYPPPTSNASTPQPITKSELNVHYVPQKTCKECNGERFYISKHKKGYLHTETCRYRDV